MNARFSTFKKAHLSLKYSLRYRKEKKLEYSTMCHFHIAKKGHLSREAVSLYLKRKQQGKNTHCGLRRSFATAATSERKHRQKIQLRNVEKDQFLNKFKNQTSFCAENQSKENQLFPRAKLSSCTACSIYPSNY